MFSRVPLSFILSCTIAAFSAFTFAELAARFPKSAGEAVYVHEGINSRRFAILIGLLVVAAGTVSSATIVSEYVGYLLEFIDIIDWPAIRLTLIGLGSIAVWGIKQSVTISAIGTLIEISELLLIIWGGQSQLVELPNRLPELMPPFETDDWLGIVAGGVLAFCAFLGFEDIVNVVEETRKPERILLRAIIATLYDNYSSLYIFVGRRRAELVGREARRK